MRGEAGRRLPEAGLQGAAIARRRCHCALLRALHMRHMPVSRAPCRAGHVARRPYKEPAFIAGVETQECPAWAACCAAKRLALRPCQHDTQTYTARRNAHGNGLEERVDAREAFEVFEVDVLLLGLAARAPRQRARVVAAQQLVAQHGRHRVLVALCEEVRAERLYKIERAAVCDAHLHAHPD